MSSESAATGSRRTVRIGKYEVVAHIATGGMGAVYRALDTEENREVALKVLMPEMAAKPAMLERFRREGRHASKMCHENIVTVYEFNEINGTYYIAMEYVEGIDLHDYIDQKGTLDPEESRQIMIQAARALAHAHSLRIVHRDIKPSNFLITRKHNKLVVKLTDLGLARETQADEFRVTRAGTTVGTVDYIAPEQARDSGLADVRSDIYSLGCTWYHMLAGNPPFPEGGLAERLYKHMEVEPPDIREFNPRVSRQLCGVLGKMLAKTPSDRFQDPTELLHALNEMTAAVKSPAKRETVADDLQTTPNVGLSTRKPSSVARKDKESGGAKKKSGATAEAEKASVRRAAERRKRRLYLSLIFGSLLVFVGVGLSIWYIRSKNRQVVTNPAIKDKPSPVDTRPIIKPDPEPNPVAQCKFKPLYKPSRPFNVQQLREAVEKPWSTVPALPENVPLLRVSRVPEARNEGVFVSLAEAVKQAPADGPIVVEINDNGPLYETGSVFSGRDVVLRAGKGYRPLIVWDHAREESLEKSRTFFKVTRGSLTLENLDVVVQVPEKQAVNWTLLHADAADLTATGCTFSQSGKSPEPVVLARFEGTRCRFTRCCVRGNQLVALDLHAPAAEVLFDGCLVLGGDAPLLQVRADFEKPATLRVVRSTLIAAETLLKVTSVGGVENPALIWFGWDALLSRAHKDVGGKMVALDAGIGAKRIRWESINCLYAGWGVLLSETKRTDTARSIREWQHLWGIQEGDDARSGMWPERVNLNVETHSAEEYRPSEKSEVGVAASLPGDVPLGCDIDALPPTRREWLRVIPGRFPMPNGPAFSDSGPPEIPKAEAQLYSGEKLDLSMQNLSDLGVFLQQKLEKQKFAERVVLHLHNAGNKDILFTPFTVPSGTSLTIYYEMKGTKPEERQPLKLEVCTSSATAAVLAVEKGALELSNLEFRLPDVFARIPPVLLKVDGNLRLNRCRLITSEKQALSEFKTLIEFHGSGEEAPDRPTHACVLNQTILLSHKSGPTCVRVVGSGARLWFQKTLLVAAGDGISFNLGESFKGRANIQCWFLDSTLAARRSAVVLQDSATALVPDEPIFVRSRDCAIVNPFPGNHKSGLLRSQDGAFGRGLLLWQSEGDALDKRLHYVFSAASLAQSDQRQVQSEWEKLWGSQAVQRLFPDADWPKQSLDGERWGMTLDRLEVPPIKTPGTKDRTVGVKMSDLGIKKKGP